MAGQPIALIFEDDDEWAGIFEETLKQKFTIKKAKTIPEIHTILEKEKNTIKIALVDIHIDGPATPRISGTDVMFILYQAGIPCIAATAYDDGKKIRDALIIGKAKDVWFKNQEELVVLRQKINSVLANNDINDLKYNPIFPSVKEITDDKLVFVVMPFSESWSDNLIMIIKDVGKKHKLKILRADDIFGPGNIIDDIWQSINKSGIIVADISTHNANVFYEIGIAHTLGKEVMLIRNEEGEKAPFDILFWRYIEYGLTPTKTKKFKDELSKVFKDYVDKSIAM